MDSLKGGLPLAPARLCFMAGGELKVLILAGRLKWDDGGWPLPSLLDRLERRGVHLQVLCLSRGRDLTADTRVVEFSLLKKRWLRAFAVRRIWSDGRLKRPDLLHVAHDEMVDLALALSETAQIPYVQTVPGFGTVERGLRLSRRWCRRLVATSPDLVDELVGSLGIPSARIALIPPGILSQRDSSTEDKTGKVPVIGTGGPLEGLSGLMVFLQAAHLVVNAGYDVEFVIASHPGEHALLRHHAQRLQLSERVTVTDYPIVGPEFWSVLGIYCQPAVVASTGRMLMQAMAHGIPSIATNVPGLKSLVDSDETGLIVPAGDPIALERAITHLLDRPDEARRIGRNALEGARTQFDLDIEADRLADLYRDVASSSDNSN